jgi:beta-N-acetylhexosaminidase
MDSFQSTGDPDVHTTIVRTLDFFVQKYREDNVFAQLVDQAVERILTLKFKLYSQFDINNVIPLENNLITIGISQQTPFEIARSSVTLISPDQSELSTLVSHPPEYGEKIVFLTDTIAARQCSNCLAQTFLPVDAMQKDVLRLYGPQTGGQIYEEFLSSYSFDEVSALLASPSQQDKLESDLRSADWVVVSFTGQTTNHPSADAFKRLLAQRPDLLRNKKIYAFSFGSPYYLDSTDISKLTAYYALYSKIPEEIEVAARVLFQELAPKGALPVSVPAIGYDLITITSPDPNQIIPLMVDLPDVNLTLGGATAEPQSTPTSVPVFKSGDTLPIRTGVIIDHNGHPVPDGTVVHFNFILAKDAANLQQIDAITTNGVARTTYRLQKSGPLEIRASSDPANLSQILTLDVTAEGGQVTAIAPTPEPTLTTQPSDTPIATDVPTSNTGTTPGVDRPGFLEWLVTMIMVWSCAYGVYIYGMKTVSVRWGIRWWLATAIGGMLVYLYLAMGLPGTENYFHQTGIWGVILLTFLGALLGWLVGFIWLRRFVSTR